MIKLYASVLSTYLPTRAQIDHFSQALIKVSAAAFTNLKRFVPQPKSWKLYLLQKQFGQASLVGNLVKVATAFALLVIFLFVAPHTNVLADWEEKVIPDNRSVLLTKVRDQITAVEIPKFQTPVTLSYISTYFSRFHQGIDLPGQYGSPIKPIAKGSVVFAGASNLGYGNLVVVRHELGYESLYAHLSEIAVKEGDVVGSETVLGNVGSTGVASGNHLHLEVHLQGAPVNPLSLIALK